MYILANRRSYLWGGFWLIGTNACALMIPWLLKLAVEGLQAPSTALHGPGWYGGAIIFTALLHGVIRVFSRTTLLHVARRIEYQIRDDLYARLIELDLPFFSSGRTGDLMSRFANDLTNVRMLIGFGVLNIINTSVLYLAGLSLMLRISPHLTLAAILPFPLMIMAVKLISAAMFRRSKQVQEELAAMTSFIEENVAAAPVIKAYCQEDAAIRSFTTLSNRYLACNMRIAQLRGLMVPIMAATGATGTLVVLLYGGSMVTDGRLTLGDFVAFSGYLAMLVWPTVVMGWILNLVQRGAASMSRLNEILLAKPTVTEPLEPIIPAALRGAIVINHLSFSYQQTPILHDISLTIPAGSRLGITGPVGSGKSTLVRLIARLYPLPDQIVSIDGIDINRLPLARLRDAIGFVPQEGFLFSRTVRENIAYGRDAASADEVVEAARMANLDADIDRFPLGYETMIGERGITLSGGQRQRTAIARALLTDPTILILDDPLSAVDARTEEAILQELNGYYGERTVIIISHRLSALRDCDSIIYLDAGSIVEQGNHDQLLTRDGHYARLWHEQRLRAEIERI